MGRSLAVILGRTYLPVGAKRAEMAGPPVGDLLSTAAKKRSRREITGWGVGVEGQEVEEVAVVIVEGDGAGQDEKIGVCREEKISLRVKWT